MPNLFANNLGSCWAFQYLFPQNFIPGEGRGHAFSFGAEIPTKKSFSSSPRLQEAHFWVRTSMIFSAYVHNLAGKRKEHEDKLLGPDIFR